MGPTAATHSLREPAQSKCTWLRHKSHFMQDFTYGKTARLQERDAQWLRHKGNFMREFAAKMLRPRNLARVFCEPAQSKCTWTSHNSNFIREFTGKMPGPRSCRRTFCASLRSRNAFGHLTRAILNENLQEKCQGSERVP